MNREVVLTGIPASPGIAIGRTVYFGRKLAKPERRTIADDKVDSEIRRLRDALEKTRTNIQKTKSKATREMGEIVARIFDAHLLILDDVVLIGEIEEKVSRDKLTSDYALYQVLSKNYESLMALQKDYFRERADDIRDVGMRILLNLKGESDKLELYESEPVIIAGRMFTPSEIVHFDRDLILGLMTELGGVTSHTAILTRALEIPSVVGLKKLTQYADKVEISVVNGNSGKVILNPNPERKEKYQEKQRRYQQFYANLSGLKDLPAETLDGHRVELAANIELPREVKAALAYGAEGIGLFRTEYLYLMKNEFPSEEEQFIEYRRIAEEMSPRPVTIRTFDLGGDKAPAGLEIGREANPFLGLRAVRLSLAKPDLFQEQLRAIMRASHYGDVRVMFPLVTGISELRKIKRVFNGVKKELLERDIPFDRNMQMGIMIEVPSAVMMAPELALEVDFFSIGTNDLIQFTLAADRGNSTVAHLFQDLHPAILRMIRMVVSAAENCGIKVGMCGEMAGDPLATVILLGLGINQFSASPLMLPEIKKIIRSITYEDARDFTNFVIHRKTFKEIKHLTLEMMKRRFADLPLWFNAGKE